MDVIQPHISVRLIQTVTYAIVEILPDISENYNQLPRSYANTDQLKAQSQYLQPPPAIRVDLAEKVNGMYRLLDVVAESGSNGHGK